MQHLIPRPRQAPDDRAMHDSGRVRAARAAYQRLLSLVERIAPLMMRLSLAVVFIWFGALKLTGSSPVASLIAATLPSSAPNVVVHVLGSVEVLLGVGLLIGRAQRLLLLALAGHLTGTFLTFLDAPGLMLQHGNPLLLTADGEFVLKNLVLISAAMLLIAHQASPLGRGPSQAHRRGDPLQASPAPLSSRT
jgi:putative oxidoreductase